MDWSDGDVVFANSTCFEEDLMKQLSVKAEKLKEGSVVISFTTGLDSPCFELLEEQHYIMSWGAATVFIHLRNDRPATRSPPPFPTLVVAGLSDCTAPQVTSED